MLSTQIIKEPKHFPKLPKSTVHLLTEPGKEAQVDFGYVGMMKNEAGVLRKTYAFIMTLSHRGRVEEHPNVSFYS